MHLFASFCNLFLCNSLEHTPTIHEYNRQDLLKNVLHVTMIKRKKIYTRIYLFISISSCEFLYIIDLKVHVAISRTSFVTAIWQSKMWFSWDLTYSVVIKEIRHRFTGPLHTHVKDLKSGNGFQSLTKYLDNGTKQGH